MKRFLKRFLGNCLLLFLGFLVLAISMVFFAYLGQQLFGPSGVMIGGLLPVLIGLAGITWDQERYSS